MSPIRILDIRGCKESSGSTPHLQTDILRGLMKAPGERTLPSETLYDEVGLKIYDEGMKNWAKWYYPTVAETQILEVNGPDIVNRLQRSSRGKAVLIELGAGSLVKTSQLLQSLAQVLKIEDSGPSVTYYALDLERKELERTLEGLCERIGDDALNKIAIAGMWGTYADGIRLIERNELCLDPDVPLHILFLGGTLGNFSKGSDDVAFLKSLPLNCQRGDTLVIGLDRAKPTAMIERAYGFAAAKDWIMNGLRVSGRTLVGDENFFPMENWERYANYNEVLGRFETGYKCRKDHTIKSSKHSIEITFTKDETLMVIFSNKYTEREIETIVEKADLKVAGFWTDSMAQYYVFALQAV